MQSIPDGETVTLSCAEGEQGRIYRGALEYEVDELDPSQFPRPRTQMMLNVGSPEQAFQAAMLPNDGVGLARMEFIFAAWVKVHPLALTRFDKLSPEAKAEVDKVTRGYADKTEYFVDKLSQGIGVIAAAFHPKPVILRLSDFKSNEYATLLGGKQFEPTEENPMIGWRGSSRYYHPEYKEGFLLEAKAIRRAREEFGLKNLKIMVPFCRTPDEGRRVLEVLREGGLVQGEDGLEVYVMAELPSNVFLADEYAQIFDGFSIGSNDLTQLILGVDRDSALVAPLFDERNAAVRQACARIIDAARRAGKKVGICGQAPSDFPDFAEFLVEQGIDSISLTPDSLLRTSERVAATEARPRRLRPARRAADLLGAAANGDLLAEPVAAYADTEPMLPNKKE
jgi:pyruvate,water dikinase